MELRHSSCKCNTDSNSVQSCCFNPVIFFVCKLCRGAFEKVEKLILHKRQQHSLKDLKGIKFIIFEERFVETDDNIFRNELNSTVAPLGCVSANSLSDINIVPPVHQDDSLADPGVDNIIDIPDESKKLKLPIPFVYLRRLTSKEISSYSRPTAVTSQNQEEKDVNVNGQDKRFYSTAKQNLSCDKTATDINASNNNNCSDSTSNENVSADLTKNDPAPEILADGKFIVANVVQSLDGIGSVQFVSVCAPVNPEKEPNSKIPTDAKQQQQHNINKALCSDVDLFKTEEGSNFENSDSFDLIAEEVSDDAGGSPSPMPVPFEVVASLTAAEIKTDDQAAGKISNCEVAELLVKVNTPQTAFPQTEIETLVRVSPSSMAGDKSVRNRSNNNYSENHSCAKRSRDFYTVQGLETHGKLCLGNQTNKKREQLCKRRFKLMTFSDGEQATHDGMNNSAEIQVTVHSLHSVLQGTSKISTL